MDKRVISRVNNATARRQLMVGCRRVKVRSATDILLFVFGILVSSKKEKKEKDKAMVWVSTID